MDGDTGLRREIIDILSGKSNLKQVVYDNTFAVFNELKEVLHEMSSELNDATEEILDKRVRIEYRDRGKFEAQLQVAGDILIFSMHTNVFEFNRDHVIWKNPYVQADKGNSYCGVINIYNFLADSFKYNRNSDEGYLIGRIFVNREKHYFVEGKRQTGIRHSDFGKDVITREVLVDIIEKAVKYALEFDLLAPPYNEVKVVNVDQLNTKIENSKMQTGKRLGYTFDIDDV